LSFLEVAARYQRQGLGIGTRAVQGVMDRYTDVGLLAYSEEADGFWDRLGWRKFEHPGGLPGNALSMCGFLRTDEGDVAPSAHIRPMEPIMWLSFDDTLPVPALAERFALPRESVIDLFERGRELTQLQWKKTGS
jgi:hypothetical protein